MIVNINDGHGAGDLIGVTISRKTWNEFRQYVQQMREDPRFEPDDNGGSKLCRITRHAINAVHNSDSLTPGTNLAETTWDLLLELVEEAVSFDVPAGTLRRR